MSRAIENKDKVKIIDLKTKVIYLVYPIDAEEIMKSGGFALYNNYKKSEVEPEIKPETVITENIEDIKITSEADLISNMTSKQLVKFMEEKGIVIEGFNELSLVNKRQKLIEKLTVESNKEVEIDEL